MTRTRLQLEEAIETWRVIVDLEYDSYLNACDTLQELKIELENLIEEETEKELNN